MTPEPPMTEAEKIQQVLCLALLVFSCSQANHDVAVPDVGDRVLRIIAKLWKGPTPIEAGLSGARLVREMLPWIEEIAGIPPAPPTRETVWDKLGKDDT